MIGTFPDREISLKMMLKLKDVYQGSPVIQSNSSSG
jgi:hypothetical protein